MATVTSDSGSFSYIKAKQRVCIYMYHGSVADLCSPLHKEMENWDASASCEQSHDCLKCGLENHSFFIYLLDRKRVYNHYTGAVNFRMHCKAYRTYKFL